MSFRTEMFFVTYPEHIPIESHPMPDTAAFDAVKRRLYEVSGCTNYYELATFLDTKPAQISDARRRLRIPVEWLRTVFLKTYANPVWILTGEGERTL